jgi:primosomal protein N' (replication factor Y)
VGAHRPRRAAAQGCRGARLTDAAGRRRPGRPRPEEAPLAAPVSGGRVDRVVPDVPAIDRELDYTVPAEVADTVEIGTIVRVPLHGRRVRGWVVTTGAEPEAPVERLRPLLAAVSAGPNVDVVALTRFAAWRWAGPRTTFLRAASPPNVVAPGPAPEPDVAVFPGTEAPLELPDAAVRLVVWPPATPRADLVASALEPDGSTIVVAPDATETEALARALRALGRHVIVTRGDRPAAARTDAWRDARRGACVVVGGRVAVLAPVPDLRGIIVLDDADEALAEERAPAWHARDLGAERARRAGARLSIVTPAPTVDALEMAGGQVVTPSRSVLSRGWPRMRIVDLRDEPPGVGLLSSSLGPALHRAIDSGGTALCVLNRKGRAHLLVCRACDAIASCERCDARLSEADGTLQCARCGASAPVRCRRCGAGTFRALRPGVTGLRDALAGLVPHRRVLAVDASSTALPSFDIAIGTEAVLHRPGGAPARLVAFLDFDQELLAPRFRALEQALWLLVRAARRIGGRDAGEILVQTRMPEHDVLRVASTGEVDPLLAAEHERRRALGFPPFGGLAEVSGEAVSVEAACDELRASLVVLGPHAGRALVRAPSVAELCDGLARADLAHARSLGRLRIDVDPLRV